MKRPNYLHCYGRESDPSQMAGRGKERQMGADWEGFAARFGFHVHERFWSDDGVSAFKGKNWEATSRLGQLLAAAERGVEVRPGDCVGVENWDRLARLEGFEAMYWAQRFRQAGVHLGDVQRMKLLRADEYDRGAFLDFWMETDRGHSESAAKSFRQTACWKGRGQETLAGERLYTLWVPAWVQVIPCDASHPDAKLAGPSKRPFHARMILREPLASHLRRFFALNRDGWTARDVVRRFTSEGVPSPTGKPWRATYLLQLLQDRRVLGEFHPKTKTPKQQTKLTPSFHVPPGTPYYPSLLTESEWNARRLPRLVGGRPPGRHGEVVNPFGGLLFDALSGSSYIIQGYPDKNGKNVRVLKTQGSQHGHGPHRGFSYEWFCRCVLSELREIDPASILGEESGTNDARTLQNAIADVQAEMADIAAYMKAHKWDPISAARAAELHEQEERLNRELSEALHRAEHPLSAAWAEQGSLIKALDTAEDKATAHQRLKARMADTIARIWLLVIPRGRTKLCSVQVEFRGSKKASRRNYLLFWRSGWTANGRSVPTTCECVSYRELGLPRFPDLADRSQAAAWFDELAACPLPD